MVRQRRPLNEAPVRQIQMRDDLLRRSLDRWRLKSRTGRTGRCYGSEVQTLHGDA